MPEFHSHRDRTPEEVEADAIYRKAEHSTDDLEDRAEALEEDIVDTRSDATSSGVLVKRPPPVPPPHPRRRHLHRRAAQAALTRVSAR